MKSPYKPILTGLFLIAMVLFSMTSYSQCSNYNSNFPTGTNSISVGNTITISSCMFGGEYTACAVVAGNTYTWSTCGDTDFDTQLTLANAVNGTVLAYNDDFCGLQSSITWTATYTGTVHVLLSRYFCSNYSTCMTLTWSCTGPGGGMNVPATGNNSYTTCTGTLYDSGGSGGNYGPNQNGYTVINPATPGAMVQISGTINTETGYDFVYIYNGAGIGGTLLWSGSGSQTVPTITSTSGPLTVRFQSDGSVNYTGFALNISCVTPPSYMFVPTNGSNSYTTCSGTLYDSGGPSGDYGVNQDGYTVLNPGTPGSMVQVSGSINTESGYDFVYIYNGVGTGGTLLWSGSGSQTVPTITSTSGPLTVRLYSDVIIPGVGFSLNISCVAPPPTNISATTTELCSGSSTTLTASGGSGTVYWYSGSCGGTQIGTGSTISVSPTTNTTYYARNYNGSNFSSCVSIYITVINSPTANAGANQSLCSGGNVTLNGTTNATNYVWTPATGLSNPNILNPIANPSSTTTYTLTAYSSTPIQLGSVYYVRSSSGTPWGYTYNETTLNDVFGSGNWLQGYFESTPAATIFNSNTRAVFLEGSDIGANALNTFLNNNLTTIEAWVASGGMMFLNAAPNVGGNINVGFGGTTLNYPNQSYYGYAVGSHPILTTPNNLLGYSWYGNYFSHSTITGSGYTTIINNGSAPLLAEKSWGSGKILLGALTSAFDHPSNSGIHDLLKNIVTYIYNYNNVSTVCTTTAQTTITVNPNPNSVTPSIVTVTPICQGGNALIQLNTSQTGVQYQLHNGSSYIGNAVTGNGSSIQLLTTNLSAASNTFNVIATNTSTNCSTSIALPAPITVSQGPIYLANNGDSRTCYVNGNNNFVQFTLGNNGIAAINPGNQDLGYVTITEYVNGSPINTQACNTDPILHPQFTTTALNRHWTISSTNAPTAPVTIRLYIDGNDISALATVANANANPNDDITGIGSLELSKYSGPNENDQWNDNCTGTTTLHMQIDNGPTNSAIVGGPGISNGQYITFQIPSFSELWLSGTNNISPLPVSFDNLTANCTPNGVKLGWITYSEINNDKFIVESSEDANEYNEIGVVYGNGNSNTVLQYEYLDPNPYRAITYYRIKQVDYNGDITYYGPIVANCKISTPSKIYPNPSNDYFHIEFESQTKEGNAQIEIIDLAGRVVNKIDTEVKIGMNTLSVYQLRLSAGMYTVKVKVANELISSGQLIINR